jgi:hypothetical protein
VRICAQDLKQKYRHTFEVNHIRVWDFKEVNGPIVQLRKKHNQEVRHDTPQTVLLVRPRSCVWKVTGHMARAVLIAINIGFQTRCCCPLHRACESVCSSRRS